MPTVLVVDDDPSVRSLLRLALEPRLEVVEAPDGAAALAAVAASVPDAVVLDVMMPGVHGMEVLATWRADPATAELPVVLLTAMDRAQDRVKGYRTGADAYLTKPFEVESLVTLLHDMLERRAETTDLLDVLKGLADLD